MLGRQLRMVRRDQCPLCQSSRKSYLFSIPDRSYGVGGLFTYVECADCGTAYQDPQVHVDDLLQCYPEHYFTHAGAGAPTFRESPTWDRIRSMLLGDSTEHSTLQSVIALLARACPSVAE